MRRREEGFGRTSPGEGSRGRGEIVTTDLLRVTARYGQSTLAKKAWKRRAERKEARLLQDLLEPQKPR
jgi:thiamine monophosphate kinase